MAWQVILSPDVQKFLKKQDFQISERLRKGLKKLKTENPFHYLEHFEGEGYYKYRIGDYRALIDIDYKTQTLKVQIMDHRKRIYEKKD